MIEVTHEWDTTDPKAELESAFAKYQRACYGDRPLSPVQFAEIRQAFFSGVHWLNTNESYDPTEILAALRELLQQ